MAAASNLPDIDALVLLSGLQEAVLWRRTLGHSLFLIPLWSAGLSWIIKRYWVKDVRYGTLFGMCLLACLVHLLLDLINSFGVVPLWPLSDWRPELAIVFIIDLILLALLAAPLLAASVGFRRELAALSTWALALALGYFMVCGSARSLSLMRLTEEASRLGIRPRLLYVFPEPFGPHRWRGVLLAGDIYRVYLVKPFASVLEPRAEIETMPDDPRVRTVRETALGRRLDWFYKAPVWTSRGLPGAAWEVSAYDLRFRSLLLDRGTEERYPFRFNFEVDPSQAVRRL